MLVKLYGASSEERQGPLRSHAECTGAIKTPIEGKPDPKHISTSYVERSNLARLHQLAGFGEAKPWESPGRESNVRNNTGSEGSGGGAEGGGPNFGWGLGGEIELQALQ